MAELQKTRRHILELLKLNGKATVNDLAGDLGLAPVSVRHHLGILIREGLVSSSGILNSGGVGRPQVLYEATPEAGRYFSADYGKLIKYLLEELKERLTEDQIESILRNVAGRILKEAIDFQGADGIEGRLEATAKFLSERGYLARWEKSEDGAGYYLLVHNCPYSTLSDADFCYMDRWLISSMLQRKIEPLSPGFRRAITCGYFVPAHPGDMG